MAVRPILSPETVTQLSKPTSTEVFQGDGKQYCRVVGEPTFRISGVSVTTSRENLGRLLVSAMISGYFLLNNE